MRTQLKEVQMIYIFKCQLIYSCCYVNAFETSNDKAIGNMPQELFHSVNLRPERTFFFPKRHQFFNELIANFENYEIS